MTSYAPADFDGASEAPIAAGALIASRANAPATAAGSV